MLKDRIKYIKDAITNSNIGNRIATGAFWSFTGTAAAKFVALVSSIICAHILTKQEYGEFGMVRSTISMFVVFGTAGLGLTATKFISEFKEKQKNRIASIYILTNGFAIFTGLLVTIIILSIAPFLAESTLKAPQLTPAIRIGALLLFISVINGAQSGTLSGFEDFKSIAINTLIGSFAEALFMLVGAYYWGVLGAVLGYGVGFVALYLTNWFSIRSNFKKNGIAIRIVDFNKDDLTLLYKFSLPAALCAIVVTPTMWVVKSILVSSSGFDELAAFEAADQWRVLILFIPMAVSQIVLPILSSIVGENETKYWRVLKINLLLNASVAFIMALLISLFSPVIMNLYGKAYVSDLRILVVLACSTVFTSIANVVGLAISSRSKMWTGFFFNCFWASMVIGFSYLFIKFGLQALGIALAFTLAYAIHALLQLLYLKVTTRRKIS